MKTNDKRKDWFIFLQQWYKHQQVLRSKKWLPGQGYNRETPWFLKLLSVFRLCHRTIAHVLAVYQESSKWFLRNITLSQGSQKDFLIFSASDCTPNLIHYFLEMTCCRSPIVPTWIFMKSTTENQHYAFRINQADHFRIECKANRQEFIEPAWSCQCIQRPQTGRGQGLLGHEWLKGVKVFWVMSD